MNTSEQSGRLESDIAALYLDNRDLLGDINRVIATCDNGDMAGLRAALLALLAQTMTRFEHEGRLMRDCEYKGALAHQNEHRRLLLEIRQQIADLDVGTANVAYIGRFLHNWILQHVVSEDGRFVTAILTQCNTKDRRGTADTPADTPDEAAAEAAADEDEDETLKFEERRLDKLEPIRWSAKLEIGEAGIDRDHRAIIMLLNAITDAGKNAERGRLADLLEQVGNETAAHFTAEEALMTGLNETQRTEHRVEHQHLLDEYANQVDEFHKNKISAEYLCRFLYRWFVRHIESFDVRLRPN